MALRTVTAAKAGLRGHLELARLLRLSEPDFERALHEVESLPVFVRLRAAGVVTLTPYPGERFASRRFNGWSLRSESDGVPELLDGNAEIVLLIQKIGQEQFEESFLRDEELSDQERAEICGLPLSDIRRIREFVDKVYLKEEFSEAPPPKVPAKAHSSVASIEIDGGLAVIGFFNREIWKGRYSIDREKLALLRAGIAPGEFRRLESVLRRLELLERRKTTLYRLLELLVELQKDYLVTGDPGDRRALTQRALASRLDVVPSVLSRLMASKAVQLPWGLEAPLKALVPTAKALLRDLFYDVAMAHPNASDRELCSELQSLYGVKLSRRSVAQYRKELALSARGRNGST